MAVTLGVEVDVQVPGLGLPLALVREAALQLGFSPGMLEVRSEQDILAITRGSKNAQLYV